MGHGRGHGRVHPAAQGHDGPPVPNLLPDLPHPRFDHGLRGPEGAAAGDLEEEVTENAAPLRRVDDLRVELHAVEAAPRVGEGRHRAVCRAGQDLEPRRSLEHEVAVAHPALGALLHVGEQDRPIAGLDRPGRSIRLRHFQRGPPVLPAIAALHLAAEEEGHELHAVADAEDGEARPEERRVVAGRARPVDARRPPGEDDGPRAAGHEFGQG